MMFDFGGAGLRAETEEFVLDEEFPDDGFPKVRDDGMVGKVDVPLEYVGESRLAVGSLEWRVSVDHLVHQDPNRPPVYRRRMSIPMDHLRRNVLFRPHK